MSRRRYDPDGYYDPDPDPAIGIIIGLAIAIFGVVSWTNPGFLNNLLFAIKPDLMELEEERLKAQQEMWRTILLIVAICAGIFVLWWWSHYRRKK